MIFVVEDEAALQRAFTDFFRGVGQDARGFSDAEAALEAMAQTRPRVVVSDIGLPGMDGLEFLRRVGAIDSSIIRIAVTATGSVRLAIQAIRDGCHEYFEKPCDMQRLLRVIARAEESQKQALELDWLRQRTLAETPPRTESAAMRQLHEQVASIAAIAGPLPPLFVFGETGVGKTFLAKEFHQLRGKGTAPFIEVNCAALPPTLIESELFGHERAAFTDARTAKAGLFEAAHGGTLFLDEVAELPLEAQAKLLRAVESGQVRRLGSLSERRVEVTLVTASNVDLPSAVRRGAFREDLFHRLAALTIVVPPLRDRPEDIHVLADQFVADCNQRFRRQVQLTDGGRRKLLEHTWPGNVRELRFAIERAVILLPQKRNDLQAQDFVLGEASGPVRVATPTSPVAASRGAFPPGGPSGPRENSTLPQPHYEPVTGIVVNGDHIQVTLPPDGIAFATLERAILAAALETCHGNVVHAAKHLRLKRDAVRYRMRKLGLIPDADTASMEGPSTEGASIDSMEGAAVDDIDVGHPTPQGRSRT